MNPSADPSLPSALNTSNHGPGLAFEGPLSIKYTADGRGVNDVGSVQANRAAPCNRLVYYFEVTIRDRGEYGRVGIGFSDKSFRLTRQPGWEANSFGYHGDDGHKFGGAGKGEDYGPLYGTGDVVGAGIHFGRGEVFFTLNGVKLKVAFRNVKATALFPTVGLHSRGECVELNFGSKPFRFDLEGMLAEEQAMQQTAVDRVPLATAVAHQAVREYLLRYGYADTLAAFDEASGMSGLPLKTQGLDAQASALVLRQQLRAAVLRGDIDYVTGALQQHYPLLLDAPGQLQAADARVSGLPYLLGCQKCIELVRAGDVQQAVVYAQTMFATLRDAWSSALASATPAGAAAADVAAAAENALREIIALVAYACPQQSPLAHLLGMQQREEVADAVNAAVLAATAAAAPSTGAGSSAGEACSKASMTHGSPAGIRAMGNVAGSTLATSPGHPMSTSASPSPGSAAMSPAAINPAKIAAIGSGGSQAADGKPLTTCSALEVCLRQLVAVQGGLVDVNQGMGPLFNLQQHMPGKVAGGQLGQQPSAMRL